MTCEEFSNEFDILYNNVMSNQAPGLDEYEKSVFLTRAQDDIVKRYFTPKGNKDFEGFDSSLKRNMDFSSLYRNYTIYAKNIAFQKLNKEKVKTNFFNKVSNINLKVIDQSKIIDNLNQDKSSYCIYNHSGINKCYFALCDNDLKSVSGALDVIFKNKNYFPIEFSYSTDDGTTWNTICEKHRTEIVAYIDSFFNSSNSKFEIKNSVADNIKDVINISLLFLQENDSVFLPINDQLLVEDTVLKKDRLLQILPIT